MAWKWLAGLKAMALAGHEAERRIAASLGLARQRRVMASDQAIDRTAPGHNRIDGLIKD